MFIGEISNNIRVPFEYAYLNGNGEFTSVSVNIWVKRLKFRDTASKSFQQQFDALKDDTAKLAEITAPLIADWEFFEDEQCTKKSPISAAWLMERPPDFVDQLALCVFETIKAQDPKAKPANSANGSAPKAKRAVQTASS